MKYKKALEEVEDFLIKSGVRYYCSEICKGGCCSGCRSFQCLTQRNLPCSLFTCGIISCDIIGLDKISSIHVMYDEAHKHVFKVLNKSGYQVYNGFTVEEYRKLDESEMSNSFTWSLKHMDTTAMNERAHNTPCRR